MKAVAWKCCSSRTTSDTLGLMPCGDVREELGDGGQSMCIWKIQEELEWRKLTCSLRK
jgi:hypothetical protein